MYDQLPAEIAEVMRELETHYDILKEDDRGGNGVLFFARNKVTAREVAIKFYAGEPGERRHDEPRLLASIKSPNVLQILDARTVGDDLAFFLTPRCTGGDLDDLIAERVTAQEAIDVTLGICAGASAIHAARLLHRDLKPGNIVLEGGVPLIADFGSVRLLPDGANAIPGSRHSILFRPPESFDAGLYSRAGDVYQVGIVAYQLLGGALPYDGINYLTRAEILEHQAVLDVVDKQLHVDAAIRRRIESGRLLNFGSLPPWARAAVPVLRRMTAVDPAQRYQSMSDAAAALIRVRSSVPNWKRTLDGARLESKGRVVEVRRVPDSDLYEAYLLSRSGPRRVAGSTPAPLQVLVKQIT